jgi:nucleoside-diphosphate-sugar epimerase
MSVFLVIGGAGFAGSNIIGELRGRGDTASKIHNLATDSRGSPAPFCADIEMIDGNNRSREALRSAISPSASAQSSTSPSTCS